MAGWSIVACEETGKKKAELLELGLNGFCCLKTGKDNTLRCAFDNIVKSFVEQVCVVDKGFWPFPPMLGNGQSVDLLKLFLVVREKGGGDAVSKNGLWDLVAKEFGLGLNLASSLKLVYVKYLEALEKWLEGLAADRYSNAKLSNSGFDLDGVLTELGAEFKGFLMEMLDSKHLDWVSESNMSAEVELSGGDKVVVEDEDSIHFESSHLTSGVVDSVEVGKLSNGGGKDTVVCSFSEVDKKCEGVEENLQSDLMKSGKVGNENEVKSMEVAIDGGKICSGVYEGNVNEMDSDVDGEVISSRKRKRESMCRMLNWVSGIARDPCDPVVDSLPDLSKWNSYGNEEIWKQVLLVRKTLLRKQDNDSSAEQSSWQKNMKMHPSMYDDPAGSSYNLRERLRCTKKLHDKKSLSQAQACSQSSSLASQTDSDSCTGGICDGDSSTEHSILDLPKEKPIPLGPRFQAQVTEWTGVVSESDPKWLGKRVWPQENVENKFLIERVPIGKGRQDSCGCQVKKSVECVKFHNTEQTMRVKRELGAAFYLWRFNRMGELVKLLWTEEEEKKFRAIVRSNRPSLGQSFWNEIYKSFPDKRKEDLVSYYYNVFLLQRRAYQNRFSPNNIDSDDDEEIQRLIVPNGSGNEAARSPGSILKKRKSVG